MNGRAEIADRIPNRRHSKKEDTQKNRHVSEMFLYPTIDMQQRGMPLESRQGKKASDTPN